MGRSYEDSCFIREVLHHIEGYEGILAIVGSLFIGKVIISIVWNLFQGLFTYCFSFMRLQYFKKFGKWAVVTGGTDGIGKEYCRELARHGLNIVIISRSLDKLKLVAEELEKDFGIVTSIIQADFTEGTRDLYLNIKEQLGDKEIGILVNNVGVMYDYPSLFLEVPETKIWQCITVNMMSVTMMTYLILPDMVKRRRGLVINMSSTSSFYPLPLMAAYSASKAYVDWFSRALTYEYSSSGIVIQTVLPSYVSTKLTRFSNFLQKPGFIVPDAPTFVRSAIRTVGMTSRTTGYWSHGLQWWFYEQIPESLWNISSWILQKMLDSGKLQEEQEKEKLS
ncbi:inactive hydroxysteroid dehydrogenase-like protein 1 isoform X1 [Tachypleus tridentatus]|uniref:inactive hydroxysteroid dehydrogenase-like protein 1 isoform X1 n=1 Tax=Tachypleus tridentatus TaxID=6853 RepID=UPI003FD43F5E